ncbi:MAG: aminotransferase class V-fold PLP-dependent enzyme [Firmicutes bacterium]|nr:aminotransferase class V-fold PLP-dependent enzyme [Bacillota bacterium]
MNMNKGVTRFLLSHAGKNPVSFHMPGHKGSEIYRENGYGDFLDNFVDCDITEIPGADNLYQAEDIIAETMAAYRRLYGVRESYLLINGSSAGLVASILTCVHRGGKLIMARNCHKSIFNGLLMAGAEPVYLHPEMIDDYGISGEISVDSVRTSIAEHPDASAVILPSPNYYGVCSDIKEIASVVHDAGMVLIVDQAHGAHLHFFGSCLGEPSKAADDLGADIVIQSTHKTLASFTQSAIVNLCTDRVDKYLFEDKLQLIESTSPSYLLMASLDINADLLDRQGERLIREWEENLKWFYEEAPVQVEGLRVMSHPMLDHTKINLDMSAYGIDGLELEELLNEKAIFPELVTGNIVMCMTGIGNKRCDYERLLEALKEIAAEHGLCEVADGVPLAAPEATQTVTMKRLQQTAIPTAKESVPMEEAAGRVCAASIIPYPPGIPIICPGEIIDQEVLDYCADLRARGEKVMGIDDKGRVLVGR